MWDTKDCTSKYSMSSYHLLIFYKKLLDHLVILFNGFPKPEACWSGKS